MNSRPVEDVNRMISRVTSYLQQVMSPRSSARASGTGDATKIRKGQEDVIPSKDDLVMDVVWKILFVGMVVMIYILKGCHTKYFDTVSQYLFIMVCMYFVLVSIKNFEDQFRLLDEINNLKEELQKLSSDVSRDKGSKDSSRVQVLQVPMQQEGQSTSVSTVEAQVTRDVTKEVHGTCVPRHKKDQEVTVNFSEQKEQSENKPDSGRSRRAEEIKEKVKNEKAEMQRQYDNSRKAWSHYLGLAEKGYKQSCGAAKFRTFYVGNLSFKANSTDIQKAFEKQLSMKVNSVVVARDSKGKSRCCAFITMRWKEFHDRNPGYNRDQETAVQEKLWADFLVNIMNEEDICGRKIYVELARSQRRA